MSQSHRELPAEGEPSLGPLRISDRPIEAGAYSWGWVDYSDYDSAGRPQEISVTLFDEPTDRSSMEKLRRWIGRPYWLTMVICYSPILAGALIAGIGVAQEQLWMSYIALAAAAVSGYFVWKNVRSIKSLVGAMVLNATRDLENYIVGREVLAALGGAALQRGDPFAYFDLRVRLKELEEVLSDDHY